MAVSFSLFCLFCCFISTSNAVGNGAVRLYRNGAAPVNTFTQAWSSGVVQIYNNEWGNICDDSSFGSDEADVICHQLGFTGASSYSNTGTISTWDADTSPTVLSQLTCSSSSYLTVTQCSFTTSVTSDCDDTTDLVLSCYSTKLWDSPTTGAIRLYGGAYTNQGLLEVYCNGEWGTVCDDFFNADEARVTCRQLGYNYYDSYDNKPLEGTSSQPIWLWDLNSCSPSSSYSCLTNCGACPLSRISGCLHSEDINLICKYSSSYAKVTTDTSTKDSCDITESHEIAVLVGAIVGSIIGLIVCIVISVAVPICICMCLGVGFGAGLGTSIRSIRRPRTRVVAQPTAVTTNPIFAAVDFDDDEELLPSTKPQQAPSVTTVPYPPQQPPLSYPPSTATPYNQNAAYPYPPGPGQQQLPVIYSANPQTNPPQAGYTAMRPM